MPNIIYQTSRKEEGPWLLDEDGFILLNSILIEADQLLKKSYSENEELDSETRVLLLANHPDEYRNIILTSATGTQLIETSIEDLLKNPHLADFFPRKLEVTIKYGKFQLLKLNIEEVDEAFILEYDIDSFDPEVKYQVKYALDRWIDKQKPSKVVRTWVSASSLISLISGVVVFIAFFSVFFPGEENAKSQLKREANALISSGVDSTNINEALELLLKLEVEYVPDTSEAKDLPPSPIWIKTLVISSLLLIVGFFHPKTILGLVSCQP